MFIILSFNKIRKVRGGGGEEEEIVNYDSETMLNLETVIFQHY
jgi:hypothetical protein